MRSKIAACPFAMGMLIAVSVFAQGAGAKPEKASQAAPVAQAQKPNRVRVKEDVQEEKLILMAFPGYPPGIRGVYGTVVLDVVIGKNGAVNSARYVSGPANLKNSAIAAVLQWRYKPTLINDVPVEVDTTVSVGFPPPFEDSTPSDQRQVLSLNVTHNGGQFSAKSGQRIVITLQTIGSGPAYGTPRVSTLGTLSQVLISRLFGTSPSVRFEETHSGAINPGGPRQVYSFIAEAVGEAKIEIPHDVYWRPVPPFRVTIQVKPT